MLACLVLLILGTDTYLSVWRTVFDITHPGFSAALAEIRTNFLHHKDLVEKQANLLHFDSFRRHHEEAESRFKQQEKEEIRKQKLEVMEWLEMTSAETSPATDQDCYASKRKDYPASGQWLSHCHGYQEWIDPQTTHIPCIWLNGKPGAGMRLFLVAGCYFNHHSSARVWSRLA